MFDPQVLAENLKRCRMEKGISQKTMAERMFLTPQAISKWERGQSTPDVAAVCAAAEILQVSVSRLLGISDPTKRYLIGVDGGGTKTKFVLMDETGCVCRCVRLGPSNPNSCGLQATQAILEQGIRLLMSGEPNVRGIFAGVAGVSVGGAAAKIQTALKKTFPGIPIRCDTDIRNVVACASNRTNCIAAICGTGSVVWAVRDESLRRFDGSGYLFERCSGYTIGHNALAAALDDRDGTGPKTALTELVENQLGATVWEKIHDIYTWQPRQLAAFSPTVFAAAEQGDALAEQILKSAADRMAELITAACRSLPDCRTLALAGSLLTQQTKFREMVCSLIPESLTPETVDMSPVWGACLLASELAEVAPPDPARFRSSYETVQEETLC